ncbi:hypothetical protein ABZ639_10440 [Saccharomonospora sp. NPDC006951]
MHDCLLIYAFKVKSKDKSLPSRNVLSVGNLLIQPLFINRLPWSRGYFETIGNLPFDEGEILKQHCFRDLTWPNYYFDERSNRIPGPVEPVGSLVLSSFCTFDDRVSEALGFPFVPD